MVYLKNFTILSREQEERILDSIRETCYTTRYPFNIFRYRDVPQLEFEPLTMDTVRFISIIRGIIWPIR